MDKWSWTDVIRFAIRDCPIIALVALFLVNLPDIQRQIDVGYQNNAEKLENAAKMQLNAAKVYQHDSERRDRDLRELNERLITELKAYHETMVHFLLDNRLRLESLEDATIEQQPLDQPRR